MLIRRLIKDYGIVILIAAATALLIRYFVIEAYRIPSTAMKPSLEPGDFIFVNKLRFRFHSPTYGEVVIFSPPQDPQRDYVKRVIALPGDTVELHNGKILLNGTAITKQQDTKDSLCGHESLPTVTYGVCWEPPLLENFGPKQVPQDSIFVVGDLRSQSRDPRTQKSWGIVPVTSVKAKALWVWLSIDPPSLEEPHNWFPKFRFDRMFKKIQ